jgi:hypothetical protein
MKGLGFPYEIVFYCKKVEIECQGIWDYFERDRTAMHLTYYWNLLVRIKEQCVRRSLVFFEQKIWKSRAAKSYNSTADYPAQASLFTSNDNSAIGFFNWRIFHI